MRFEQWAQNPTCQANTISAVHNIKMADVARSEGFDPTFGQSPYALARGETFERNLLWNDGERLIKELVDKQVLPQGSDGLADFRITMNGGQLSSLEVAIEATRDFMTVLADAAADDRSFPSLVASATIRIPRGVMLPEAILIIDALAVRTDRDLPELIVGEIKTYADRGGHTDAHSLAVARAQAGLYVHAVELLVEELGLEDRVRVRTDGFLVLSKPGSNFPSVRAGEEFRFQAERARRGFELLEAAAQGLPPFQSLGRNPLDSVLQADVDYTENCMTFCDRAARCWEEAVAVGNPTILGENVRRFVGDLDLHRVMELLGGADPSSPAEIDFLRRVDEVEQGVPV